MILLTSSICNDVNKLVIERFVSGAGIMLAWTLFKNASVQSPVGYLALKSNHPVHTT